MAAGVHVPKLPGFMGSLHTHPMPGAPHCTTQRGCPVLSVGGEFLWGLGPRSQGPSWGGGSPLGDLV